MIKDLVKGKPYFSDLSGTDEQYNYLNKNIECDILVVGGGIDGAITSYFLAKSGIDTVIIDANRFGHMSTSVATALLEYQLDEHADDLKKTLSEKEIIACYKLNLKGLDNLNEYILKNGNNCHYSKRPTMVFTQKDKNIKNIKKEYDFRVKHKLPVKLVTEDNSNFSFPLKQGVIDDNGGAELNPYLAAKDFIKNAVSLGARAFENTRAISIIHEDNHVIVTTNYGYTIIAKKVVCATGYDTSLFSHKPLCKLHLSYSVTTSEIPNFEWHKRTLLHNDEVPYHYIRMLHDNRVIIGGEDIVYKNKISKAKAEKKYNKLIKYFFSLFPDLKGNTKISFDYKFCGLFGTTKNNVGVVGPSKQNPNIWYMLGYGANGIINCLYGAEMLADLWHGKTHEYLYLFSPDRDIY